MVAEVAKYRTGQVPRSFDSIMSDHKLSGARTGLVAGW